MKTFGFFVSGLFLFLTFSTAQEQHTYGPVKENYFRQWTKYSGQAASDLGSNSYHSIGTDNYNGIYETRCINFWQWTYDNIPTQATVTKVTIKFRVHYSYLNEDLLFSMHNIGYPFGASGVNFYEQLTPGNKILEQTVAMPNYYAYYNTDFTSGPVFDAVQSAVQSGNYYLTLGMKRASASMPVPSYQIDAYDGSGYADQPAFDLTINYTTPNQYYTFVNKIDGTQNYGALVVDNNKANPVTSGSPPQTFSFNTNHTVRTNELPFIVNWNSTSKAEKHNRFFESAPFDYSLNRSFSVLPSERSTQDANFVETKPASFATQLIDGGSGNAGNIEIRDPWRYYKDANNDWFQTNQFISYTAPFAIENNSTNSYGGVFLGQGSPNWNPPYYSVNAPSQSINGYSSYFLNWDATNASIQNSTASQTGVVFTSSGATVIANYKAQHGTSVTTGIVNGGQRKILRTGDGTLHTVYESAGKVWYEWKPSSSSNWELGGLTDVAGSEAKSPSITSRGNNVIIVYQKKNGDNYDIEFKMFETGGGGETPVVIASNLGFYTDDAQPVAASNSAGRIYFAWKQASNSGDAGIHYNAGLVSTQGEYSNAFSGKITNTSSSSSSPSVAVGSIADGNPWYHYPLVWTEGSAIYYVDVQYRSNSGWQNYNSYGTTISAGSGYTYNYNPSVICYGATNVRATWIGRRYESDPGEGMSKQQAGGGGTWVTRVIYNNQDAPGTFEVYGENVNSVNINKNNNGSDVSHVVAWSANSGTEAHCRTSEGYGGEFKIGSGQINGKDVQLSNGTSFTDMHGFMLDGSTSAPYKLKLSDNDISQMSKTQFAAVNNGREGIVRDSSAGFYFAIGDVTVDDASITFDGNPDTIKKYSVSMLNSTLESRPFALENNSNFVYSVQYGITDSAFAVLVLKDGKTVNFKVQLIDDQSKTIIGEFDNVVFSAQNINQYKNIGYQVNTEGIGNRTVRIRLVVNAYSEAQFALSNRYNNESIINLGKQGSQRTETGFRGSVEIKEYALSQNYPNPFNPTTMINYALPKAGNVVLKVYDVLGKEVATLVNNYKESGRYSVEFDASKLSSGMYVYKLSSGSFSEVKKMMLLR